MEQVSGQNSGVELFPEVVTVDWCNTLPLTKGRPSVSYAATSEGLCEYLDAFHTLNEIVDGLFLTSEFGVRDREACRRHGLSLIVTLNAHASMTAFRVCEVSPQTGKQVFRKFENLSSFVSELLGYIAEAQPTYPVQSRKVFIRSICAEDDPAYDLSQHFQELCWLIELVLAHRRVLRTVNATLVPEAQGDAVGSVKRQDDTWLPAVCVHCMAGVSRSATAVAAYLMKRSGRSVDDVVPFIREQRPVVSPNPGFYSQLREWKSMQYQRLSNPCAADLVARELDSSDRLSDFMSVQLQRLVVKRQAAADRRFFGLAVAKATVSRVGRELVNSALCSLLSKMTEADMYTDVPYFFTNVSELVISLYHYAPHAVVRRDDDTAPLWSDTPVGCVVRELAFGAFAGNVVDGATKVFCLLDTMLGVQHSLFNPGERPFFWECSSQLDGDSNCTTDGVTGAIRGCRVYAPSHVIVSFPFLWMVAPLLPLMLPTQSLELPGPLFQREGVEARPKSELLSAEPQALGECGTGVALHGTLAGDLEVLSLYAVMRGRGEFQSFVSSHALAATVNCTSCAKSRHTLLTTIQHKMISGVLAANLLFARSTVGMNYATNAESENGLAGEEALCEVAGAASGKDVLELLHILDQCFAGVTKGTPALACSETVALDYLRTSTSALHAGLASYLEATKASYDV